MEAGSLHSNDETYQMNLKPLASRCNRISKTFLRSKTLRVHFRDLVCWVLGVKFLFLLTLIHSKVSTSGIQTFCCILDTIPKPFEPILPRLWHSGFTRLQPSL